MTFRSAKATPGLSAVSHSCSSNWAYNLLIMMAVPQRSNSYNARSAKFLLECRTPSFCQLEEPLIEGSAVA